MMHATRSPVLKDLVLLGGGHSHVAVLKHFGMHPMPGLRLTLICRDTHTPYSGMLPGYLAGHYAFDDVHIDLGRLTRFAGARFIHAEAIGLDTGQRQVWLRDRPPIAYDVLSINIGSAPQLANVPGASEAVVPVKPINNFLRRWEELLTRVQAARRPLRIGVVGGGAGGVEVMLATHYRLQRERAALERDDTVFDYHLLTVSDDILPTHHASVRARFKRALAQRGIAVHTQTEITRVEGERLISADGQTFTLDEVLWVTAAGGAGWLQETGLALGPAGFIRVDPALQSVSHPGVFAAGDIADVVAHPREKAGVYAVRQGKPLARNLRRALLGQPLKPFRPQRRHLSLITTGDRYAVASRGRFSAQGHWVWRWKDWIDRRFMAKYSVLPEMDEAARVDVPAGLADVEARQAISAMAMRCGGCGAKVGSTVLDRALAGLAPAARDDVLVGLHDPDDAAVVSVPPGQALIHTVDFFRAFIEDPYVFGQVAANHCLGDIFAMGGQAQTALAIATVPYAIERKVEDTVFQMMSGALDVLDHAGVALVGGHTGEGAELGLGFAINGLIDPAQVLRKSGMRSGDALILTKPLGTGTLFAADMRTRAKGRWIEGALKVMRQSNRLAADILRAHGATACTDVTGFGLLGHLLEMVKPSGIDVALQLAALPVLDGALETMRMGVLSSLQPENVRLRRAIRDLDSVASDERYPLLFDPQTAGGLLASVPAGQSRHCVTALRRAGYVQAARIGSVHPRGEALEPVRVRVTGHMQHVTEPATAAPRVSLNERR